MCDVINTCSSLSYLKNCLYGRHVPAFLSRSSAFSPKPLLHKMRVDSADVLGTDTTATADNLSAERDLLHQTISVSLHAQAISPHLRLRRFLQCSVVGDLRQSVRIRAKTNSTLCQTRLRGGVKNAQCFRDVFGSRAVEEDAVKRHVRRRERGEVQQFVHCVVTLSPLRIFP